MLAFGLRYAGGAALAAIAGAALLAPAAGAAAHHSFHFQAVAEGRGGEIESVCGATFLRDNVAITARHCVLEITGPIRLACASGAVAEAARIERVVSHPTHDIALIRIGGARGCAARAAPPSLAAPDGGPYHIAAMAPPNPDRSRPVDWTVSTLTVDDIHPDGPVIRARTGRDCPRRGDSGAGLFSDSERGPALHGVLIGGSPDCPGISVFVRLEPVGAWIERQAALLGTERE